MSCPPALSLAIIAIPRLLHTDYPSRESGKSQEPRPERHFQIFQKKKTRKTNSISFLHDSRFRGIFFSSYSIENWNPQRAAHITNLYLKYSRGMGNTLDSHSKSRNQNYRHTDRHFPIYIFQIPNRKNNFMKFKTKTGMEIHGYLYKNMYIYSRKT